MVLHVWAHAGQQAERRVLQAQLERFNQQSDETQLKLTFIPERDYNALRDLILANARRLTSSAVRKSSCL